MKQKYVVLHAPKPAPDRTFRDSEATIAGAPKFRMSAEDLDQKEAARIARDPDFVAAPIMPVRLIEPLVRTADKWTSLSEARGDGVHGTFKNGDTPVDDEDIAWGVRAVRAHTSPFTGKDIVVAVLDTGIEANHPAFPAGLSIEQQDFTGEGNGDMHGHGTHCAGTIFGRPVDGVRIGVAPGVTRALIGKVLGAKGGGASYDIAKAIQ